MTSRTETADTPWAALNRFFFTEEVPFGMAIMRIMLPWVLIFDGFRRWYWVRELYSSDGATAPLAENFGYLNWLPELPGPMAVALYTAMIFLFITTSIGWNTRFSLIVSTALYYYFSMLDCMGTMCKYNVVAIHLMVLMALSPCGEVWSVDRWLKTSHSGLLGRWSPPPAFGIWAQRLNQALLGMIYLGASFTKMHTPAFFSGDQLMYWMMTDIHDSHPLGNYLSQYPLVLVLFAYITIVWEIVFLFVVWGRFGRIPMLAVGVIFHVMTALTLGLYIFPMVMCLSYLCFVKESDVFAVRGWLRKLGVLKFLKTVQLPQRISAIPWSQARWAVAGGFAVVAMLVMLGGVQAEQMLDVYGMRGKNGPLSLKEISADEVKRLLTTDNPLDVADKFLAVDFGTTAIGDHLLTRSTTFKQGDTVLVQVTFNPPHEDMWVECLFYEGGTANGLRSADDKSASLREITRVGQIAPRENLRANFSFVTDRSMDPGQYTFKIRCGGREVLKKSFTLTANSKLPTAAKDALDQDLPSSTAQCPVPMVEQSEPDQKETAQPESAQSEPDQSEPALVEPEQPRTTKSAPE